ncbi:hypothetical protein GOODEAATRI_014266 [Goodea atripinnis]|uniref:C2H2-type domain-containing protein n=1 Tax=Goodea atripinnis TaxID=208336 RepID=A0ABV0MJP0_9TELE
MISADVKEEALEEQSPDMDQQELELLHIKEESERIWASQDEKQLNVKETDDTRFPLTVVNMNSEEDEEKPLFSQLHQHQTEDKDLPSIMWKRFVYKSKLNRHMRIPQLFSCDACGRGVASKSYLRKHKAGHPE